MEIMSMEKWLDELEGELHKPEEERRVYTVSETLTSIVQVLLAGMLALDDPKDKEVS